MTYSFFKKPVKFNELNSFDTVVLKVCYRNDLKKTLEILKDLGFVQEFDEYFLDGVYLDLMSEYAQALIINTKTKTLSISNYDHVVGELSGAPYYWSKEKIALVNHIHF